MKRPLLLFLLPLLFLAACNRDPKAAAKNYVDKGNRYYDRAKYKEASIMYRKALQKDLRSAEAWYHLGLTDLKVQAFGDARRSFLRAFELDANNTDAAAKAADLDLLGYRSDPQGQKALLNEAKDYATTLLKKDPKSYDGLRLTGYIAFLNKDLDTAVRDFKAANDVKPNQTEVGLLLVDALFLNKQQDEAEKLAQHLISVNPKFTPAYTTLYRYYLSTRQADKGEQLLKTRIANNPKDESAYRDLAAHYFMTNRKDEAAATLGRLTSNLKDFPNAYGIAGDFYLAAGDPALAIQNFQTGETKDPKHKLQYSKRIVDGLTRERKWDEAAKLVGDLRKQDPKDTDLQAMHATILLETSRKKEDVNTAISELQPLLNKGTSNPVLHYNLGRAYLAKGDTQSLEQARIQFQEALKAAPNYVPAKLALGQLELLRGENPRAIQTADEILSVAPSNLSARLIRTRGLMNTGDVERSREELNALLKANPGLLDARFQLALLDFKDGRYPEAEAGLTELYRAHDPRALSALIQVKISEHNVDGALQLLRTEMAQHSDHRGYDYMIANIEYKAGRYKDAIADYTRLFDSDQKNWDVVMKRGECKRMTGDMNGALADFEKAHSINGSEPTPILQEGLLYDARGQRDQSRKAYEDVLKIQPDNSIALNNLAYSKAEDGVDLDQALSLAERARQKNPNDPNIADTLSLIYIRKNLTDDSLRLLRQLEASQPNSATIHLHMAMALYQKGDKPSAKKELETANRDKPSEKEQANIKDLLAKIG